MELKIAGVSKTYSNGVGIDPFALLIDRVPDDNTKPVTLLTGTAVAQNGTPAGVH